MSDINLNVVPQLNMEMEVMTGHPGGLLVAQAGGRTALESWGVG